ncbi:MAG TPA: hypothetical protein VF474_11170 [Phenylobacterium sp.]
MTADPASVDPAEAMLAELAGLDPPLARPARPPLGGRGAARRPHRAKLGLTACAAPPAPYFDTKPPSPPRTPSHPLPAPLAQAPWRSWRLGGRLVL